MSSDNKKIDTIAVSVEKAITPDQAVEIINGGLDKITVASTSAAGLIPALPENPNVA